MTSLSPETNADLVRLEHADIFQLSETLKSLLERGEALDRVVEIIERKIDNGAYVLSEQLAALIVHTKSASLYARTRQQLFTDDWALLQLYRDRYPDPDIEKDFCTRLYEIALNDGEWRRGPIADAMRDGGTEIALPTLEAIVYNLAQSLEVKEMVVQPIESAGVSNFEAMLTKWEAGSRKQFVTSVTNAITAIKERASAATPPPVDQKLSPPIQEVPESQNPHQSETPVPTRLSVRDQLDAIELQLHSHVKRRLQERYGTENDAWWFEGIPETIRLACTQLRERDKGRQEPFNYAYLIDLRTVLDKNWSLFEPDFAKIRHMVPSKKDFLDQIAKLNEVRNRYAHPIRAPEPDTKSLVDDRNYVSTIARTVVVFCGHPTN